MADAPTQQPRPRSINLELWHVILLLAVQCIALAVAWGKLEQGQEDLSRRMTAIEQGKTITRDEWEDFRADIRGRFDNVEQELSRLRTGQ